MFSLYTELVYKNHFYILQQCHISVKEEIYSVVWNKQDDNSVYDVKAPIYFNQNDSIVGQWKRGSCHMLIYFHRFVTIGLWATATVQH